jgi:hypothetical protein
MACTAPGKMVNSASSAHQFDNIVTAQRALTRGRSDNVVRSKRHLCFLHELPKPLQFQIALGQLSLSATRAGFSFGAIFLGQCSADRLLLLEIARPLCGLFLPCGLHREAFAIRDSALRGWRPKAWVHLSPALEFGVS